MLSEDKKGDGVRSPRGAEGYYSGKPHPTTYTTTPPPVLVHTRSPWSRTHTLNTTHTLTCTISDFKKKEGDMLHERGMLHDLTKVPFPVWNRTFAGWALMFSTQWLLLVSKNGPNYHINIVTPTFKTHLHLCLHVLSLSHSCDPHTCPVCRGSPVPCTWEDRTTAFLGLDHCS